MEKIVVKTTQSLSFIGRYENELPKELLNGIMLKINEHNNYRVWIPENEIKKIIKNGEEIQLNSLRMESEK